MKKGWTPWRLLVWRRKSNKGKIWKQFFFKKSYYKEDGNIVLCCPKGQNLWQQGYIAVKEISGKVAFPSLEIFKILDLGDSLEQQGPNFLVVVSVMNPHVLPECDSNPLLLSDLLFCFLFPAVFSLPNLLLCFLVPALSVTLFPAPSPLGCLCH